MTDEQINNIEELYYHCNSGKTSADDILNLQGRIPALIHALREETKEKMALANEIEQLKSEIVRLIQPAASKAIKAGQEMGNRL